MTDFPITRSPQLLYDGYSEALSLKNNDTTNIIYVGESTTKCQQGQGLPIGPLSTVVWDAQRPLWAVCPTLVGTAQVSLTAVSNTGAVFSPGDLASQILTQGLAQQIANDIFITGTPPVDKYTLLNDSGLFGGGAGYTSAIVSTAGYQSVALTFANGFPTPILPGEVSITWYATQGGAVTDIIGYDDYIVGTGALSQMIFPVRGPFYRVVVTGTTGGGQLKTYGSYKAVQNVSGNLLGAGSATGTVVGGGSQGIQSWNGNIPASTTWTWQPDVIPGQWQIDLRWTNGWAANNNTTLLRVPTNIYPLVTYLSPYIAAGVANQTDIFTVNMPPVPAELSIANGSTTATLNFRATIVPIRPFA